MTNRSGDSPERQISTTRESKVSTLALSSFIVHFRFPDSHPEFPVHLFTLYFIMTAKNSPDVKLRPHSCRHPCCYTLIENEEDTNDEVSKIAKIQKTASRTLPSSVLSVVSATRYSDDPSDLGTNNVHLIARDCLWDGADRNLGSLSMSDLYHQFVCTL